MDRHPVRLEELGERLVQGGDAPRTGDADRIGFVDLRNAGEITKPLAAFGIVQDALAGQNDDVALGVGRFAFRGADAVVDLVGDTRHQVATLGEEVDGLRGRLDGNGLDEAGVLLTVVDLDADFQVVLLEVGRNLHLEGGIAGLVEAELDRAGIGGPWHGGQGLAVLLERDRGGLVGQGEAASLGAAFAAAEFNVGGFPWLVHVAVEYNLRGIVADDFQVADLGHASAGLFLSRHLKCVGAAAQVFGQGQLAEADASGTGLACQLLDQATGGIDQGEPEGDRLSRRFQGEAVESQGTEKDHLPDLIRRFVNGQVRGVARLDQGLSFLNHGGSFVIFCFDDQQGRVRRLQARKLHGSLARADLLLLVEDLLGSGIQDLGDKLSGLEVAILVARGHLNILGCPLLNGGPGEDLKREPLGIHLGGGGPGLFGQGFQFLFLLIYLDLKGGEAGVECLDLFPGVGDFGLALGEASLESLKQTGGSDQDGGGCGPTQDAAGQGGAARFFGGR